MGKKLALVIFLGLILRLISINQSLWLDEAIGAIAARDFTYSELIKNFIVIDNHPPGYYLLLKFWTGIFGFTELALRSLSIIFGLLTVFITAKIADKFSTNKNIPLLASLLVATSQIHVYYSQEARMYTMAGFFAACTILYFIKAFRDNKNFDWAIFSISVLGLMLSDYMPIFLLPVFFLYILSKRRNAFFKLIVSFTPLLLSGILWAPILAIQMANYSVVPDSFLFGGATVKQLALLWMKFALGRISLTPKIIYYSLVGLVSIPIFSSIFSSLRRKHLLLWLWLIVPIVLGFLASFIFPVFSYFRYVYILPAFYILVALGNKKLLIYLILIFNFVSLLTYYTDEKQQREQWRQAVNYIESQEPEGVAVLFEFPEPFAPYRWYSKEGFAFGATDSISAGEKTTQKTMKLINNKNKIYHFDYLGDISDSKGLVEKAILAADFKEVAKTTQFVGVGAITIYEKTN